MVPIWWFYLERVMSYRAYKLGDGQIDGRTGGRRQCKHIWMFIGAMLSCWMTFYKKIPKSLRYAGNHKQPCGIWVNVSFQSINTWQYNQYNMESFLVCFVLLWLYQMHIYGVCCISAITCHIKSWLLVSLPWIQKIFSSVIQHLGVTFYHVRVISVRLICQNGDAIKLVYSEIIYALSFKSLDFIHLQVNVHQWVQYLVIQICDTYANTYVLKLKSYN